MKICRSILEHLNIEPGAILPCCKSFIHNIPQSIFTGYNDLEKYIEKLQVCLDTFHNFCLGCQNRETYEAPGAAIRDMLNISLLLINHHRYYCNCKCVYCPFWRTPVRPASVRPLLDEVLSSGRLDKYAVISWGGGESTLLPEFEDTAAMLLGKGLYQQVLTNALCYSPATASILAAENGNIMVSLDSGTEKTYRTVKGINGLQYAWDILKRYAAAARNIHDVTLKYIIFDANNSNREIDSFFDLCSSLGQVTVCSAFEAFQIADLSVSQASKDALLYFEQQAGERGHPYCDWTNLMNPGLTDAVINHTGPVYYWGCGDFYKQYKYLFAHCPPRCILLDSNPDKIEAMDGIPVRHPADVLPHEERLPIVVFAWDQTPIAQTLAADYPWYARAGQSLWLALAGKKPRNDWFPIYRRE
jgi:pyruvate-formate lyase-activating enzyme